MMDTVITTEGLTRRFGTTLAVDGLSLQIERGEIFGLLGHNGAGKTTTVRLLNGVLAPTKGSARVLGLSPVTDGPALRRRTGVLTETPALYEPLSARDNLRLFAALYDLPARTANRRVDDLLEQFALGDRAGEKVGGYSKGMKQRLALARAFLHEPELLFLDEPTAGLDPVAARQVNDLVVHLSRDENRTVVLATHNLHDAQQFCDRVAVLEQGRVVALGSPTDLAQQYARHRLVEMDIDPAHMTLATQTLAARPGLVIENSAAGKVAVSGMAYEAIPDVLEQLVSRGVRIYRVMPDEPSLEDVYFALHSQEKQL